MTRTELGDLWARAVRDARAGQSKSQHRRSPLAWLQDELVRELRDEYRRRYDERVSERASWLDAADAHR